MHRPAEASRRVARRARATLHVHAVRRIYFCTSRISPMSSDLAQPTVGCQSIGGVYGIAYGR